MASNGQCLRLTAAPEPNAHAAAGEPLYERFLTAWVETDMKVKLCFHGTAEANVDVICQNGLDPQRRRGQAFGKGEYFADDATISLPYCKGGKVMLVFAVLTDPSGITHDSQGIVVVHRVEHQLPLFKLHFEPNLQPYGAMAGAVGGRAQLPAHITTANPLYAQGQALLNQLAGGAMARRAPSMPRAPSARRPRKRRK